MKWALLDGFKVDFRKDRVSAKNRVEELLNILQISEIQKDFENMKQGFLRFQSPLAQKSSRKEFSEHIFATAPHICPLLQSQPSPLGIPSSPFQSSSPSPFLPPFLLRYSILLPLRQVCHASPHIIQALLLPPSTRRLHAALVLQQPQRYGNPH